MRARRRATTHGGGHGRIGALRAFVALVVAVSLLAPAVTEPSPAAAAPRAVLKSKDLPALPSKAAPRTKPAVPDQGIDDLTDVAPHPSELGALNRRSKASVFDPARSTPLDAETTPSRRVYKNPDGSHSCTPAPFATGTPAAPGATST